LSDILSKCPRENGQNIKARVGKKILCPRCNVEGVLTVKEIPRKTVKYYAFYVYHYIPDERKILWHYYGIISEVKKEGVP